MNHNLRKIEVDGVKWWECVDCLCTYQDKHWWIVGMKSRAEPECSADNLDWERQAEDGGLKWS